MDNNTTIQFVVTVEFRYNSIPRNDQDTFFHVRKSRWSFGNTVEDAVESAEEVLKLLRSLGYKVNGTFRRKNPKSYAYSVMCRYRGAECIVKIEDVSKIGENDLKKVAKEIIADEDEYREWLFSDESDIK